jgi:SAM-dependent methyltransferase
VRPSVAALGERAALAVDTLVGLPAPYPGPYMDAWLGLIRARALISAVRLGVFEALPGTTPEVAARTGCQAERLDVLLEALQAMRYVRRRRGRWRATRRTRASFGPAAALPLGATVGSLAASNWEVMAGLEDVLRGGAPPGLHDGSPTPAVWGGYQAAMVELNAMVAAPVLAALGHPRRLLDIGGGPGSFAAAACERWPDTEVVIADLPQAASLGRERITAAGLADRVRYVDGDARTSDVGSAYDAVTLLHVLHNVDRETGVGLLRAAGRAAAPTGTVTVLEIEGTRTLVGTLGSLTFCGWMGARAWVAADLEAMAAEAGLTGLRVRRPLRLGGSLLLQARPV